MFDGPSPRLYTIDSSTHFLETLADALLAETGGDVAKLTEMRVLLPTRRAGRALADAFLRRSGGDVVLLPRILPLGDIDEDELSLSENGVASDGVDGFALPPAIPGLTRQLMLARLIMGMPAHRLQPDQATALAHDLAALLDRMDTEECNPAELKNLLPDDFASHWQDVLKFLTILIDQWPALTTSLGVMDPARRRNTLLRTEAALWAATPPQTPIIAAGSTGSIPATAELLRVICRLPRGAVILPGLDRDMPDDSWDQLGMTHPQYGLRQLLRRLGVERQNVRPLGPDGPADAARQEVLSAALRPAGAPDVTPPSADTCQLALKSVARVDCPGASEEALVAALIMRRTLESSGKTCALVTPDRELARRAATALQRWGVEVDDSAGQPLSSSPPGAFLRLVIAAAAERLAPVSLLAVLKHPLCAGGMAAGDFRALVRAFEVAVLHGPRSAPGIAGLKAALNAVERPARLTPLLKIVERVFAPLETTMSRSSVSFADLLHQHVAAAEALAETDDTTGSDNLWKGEAGEAAAGFVSELAEGLQNLSKLPPHTYSAMIDRLMSGRAVRPRFGAHPRLFIWGLMEARLQHADTIILGGLNEGVWPPSIETNPWMSRQMMADIGLDMPERRIGLTAHDFQQAFMAREVYLTRAVRLGGAETVPSRWLLRLDNLLRRAGAERALTAGDGEDWIDWATLLDEPPDLTPCEPPRPVPPLDARPTELSVTQVETLIRDPYSIYARKILNLNVLDPLDADPGAADRGSMIHAALDAFVDAFPDQMPENAYAKLLEFGRIAFADHIARPGVRAFWWPRFERIAEWFVDWQQKRLADGWQMVLSERFGDMTVGSVDGGFRLFAKPDRIDHRAGVGLAIIDYKTGQPPSAKQVAAGLAPQLPLEAIIAARGGFKGVPDAPTKHLVYIHLSGGRQPGRAAPLKVDVSEVMATSISGVQKLITRFADPRTPYLSRPRPQFESRFGDYDHLARVDAWGAGRTGEGDT